MALPRHTVSLSRPVALPTLRRSQHLHDDVSIAYNTTASAILGKDVNIVLQQRRLPPEVERELEEVVEDMPSFRQQVTMDVAESCNPLQALLRRFSASPALSQWLLQDLQAAAKALTSLLGHGRIDATLALVDSTVCPRLHADYVTVRALCTYHGQGTHFVANRFADRRRLQRAVFGDTQGFGLKEAGALQQASAGDLLFLKGHAFAGNAGYGAVHKSPLASPEEKRLVLTLDEASARHARAECSYGARH